MRMTNPSNPALEIKNMYHGQKDMPILEIMRIFTQNYLSHIFNNFAQLKHFILQNWHILYPKYLRQSCGSLGIAPTRNFTHFPKIGIVVAGERFYSYYIHQKQKSGKEKKIVRKKLSFMHTKIFRKLFTKWVQFCVGAILRLPGLYIYMG